MNKISMDKKYKTRDGCYVRVLCVDAYSDVFKVVGLIKNKGGEDSIVTYTEYGKSSRFGETNLDLIEQPEEHTIDVWAVLYKKDDWIKGVTEIFRKEQDAKDYAYHRGFGIKAMKKFTLKLTEGDTLKEGEME